MTTRNTLQKEIIRSTLCALKTHPTAPMLYEEIHRTHPSISRSTVYRVLGQMVEEGTVLRLGIAGSENRYDGTTADHCHIRCRVCGRVDDLPAAIYAFYEAIFIVRSEQGTVYLDYSRFAPSKAGATMGRIKTVAIGFDHYWGLGRSMGVSAIADVDVVAKEVHRLLNLTELTDADLSLTPDTVVYCNEPSAYRDNFELYRIAERDLKFDTGKTITMPEKGYLSVVPSIHDTKGCGAAMGAGSAIFGLCACALAIGLGKVKGGKR